LPLLALAIVALAWLSTLQRHIGAANDPVIDPRAGMLLDDTGEFAVAWHTWGVTHPPAYPLLNLSANVMTRVFGALGAAPMVAASLVSMTFGLAALLALAQPIFASDRHGLGTAAAILLPAFGLMVWVNASVPEAYSLGLFLAFASLAVALAAGRRPAARTIIALGLVYGLAVGHHRTLLVFVPALAVAAWPARRLGWRVWLAAGAAGLASLAIYLYLPLAALAGSPWIYGRSPLTWAGFSDAVLAREYSSQITPPAPAEWLPALAGRVSFMAGEAGALGAVLGLAGLLVALTLPALRRPAAAYGLVVAGYLLAPVGQYLLLGTHMLVMVASLALAGLSGLGVAAIGQSRPLPAVLGLGLAVLVAARALSAQIELVRAFTQDPLGRHLVAAVAGLAGEPVTIVESWGPRYHALAFAKWVSGELAAVELIDARSDLQGLPPAESLPALFYTTESFF
jgi:hypothetical protein